jgi:hypothetical protein
MYQLMLFDRQLDELITLLEEEIDRVTKLEDLDLHEMARRATRKIIVTSILARARIVRGDLETEGGQS